MNIFKKLATILVVSSFVASPLAMAETKDYKQLSYPVIHSQVTHKNGHVVYYRTGHAATKHHAKHPVAKKHKNAGKKHYKTAKKNHHLKHVKYVVKRSYHRVPVTGTGKD